MKQIRQWISFLNEKRNTEHIAFMTHRPLFLCAVLSVSARIYYLISIDYPAAENASWLIPLIGAVLALPAVLSSCFLLKRHGYPLAKAIETEMGKNCSRLFFLLFSLLMTYESACMLRILTGSAEYATLYRQPTSMFLIPTGVIMALIASKGANGVGGAAGIWLKLLPIFYLVILLMEIPTSQIGWLFPILGPGIRKMMPGAVMCAFYFTLIPLIFTVSSGEFVDGRKNTRPATPVSPLYAYLACILIPVFLLLVHTIVYPNIPGVQHSRSIQLNMLLANGKSNRAVQLPILIVWFSSFAITNAFDLYLANAFFSLSANREYRIAPFALGAIALLISICRLSMKDGAMYFSLFGAIPVFLLFLISGLKCAIKKP
ncbi:MAG: GerAB/ArcD/ProY family transporter [Clostridia bacterium]|nr:GerAB/ArcD/ProY family transporter [Clostridia bacterium]MBQ4157446.1 GerAB/ArcD/ProY family transporter [Clostridia bacterium]